MATKKKMEAMNLYKGLMEEAKVRCLSINTLSNDQRGIPSPLVREYAYLQIRMICEIIGLGCLVAHGDLVDKGSAALKRAYAPGEIMKALGALHDDFYPVPAIPQRTEIGWHLADYDKPYMTKEELPLLWAKCGNILHRGNLKKLLGPQAPFQNNFDDVNDAGQKLMNLLSVHRIVTLDRQTTFVTFLQTDDLGGAVQVAIGEVSEEAAVASAGAQT